MFYLKGQRHGKALQIKLERYMKKQKALEPDKGLNVILKTKNSI
jgi:hypothetical protein